MRLFRQHRQFIKQTQAKAKKVGAKKNTKPQPKSVIPLRELPDLAKTIAESNSEVPLSILLVLKHIIRARAECADWFSCQDGDEEYEESNEGHRHAIRVSNGVLEVLQPQASSKEENQKKRPIVANNNSKPVSLNLANSFNGLEVEGPISDLEETIVQTPIVKKNPKTFERTYEIEDPYSDYLMEIFFFFHDLNNLRANLKQLWQDYQDGKVNLTVSSSHRHLFNYTC
jgi:hypothetical protein